MRPVRPDERPRQRWHRDERVHVDEQVQITPEGLHEGRLSTLKY